MVTQKIVETYEVEQAWQSVPHRASFPVLKWEQMRPWAFLVAFPVAYPVAYPASFPVAFLAAFQVAYQVAFLVAFRVAYLKKSPENMIILRPKAFPVAFPFVFLYESIYAMAVDKFLYLFNFFP